MAVGGTNIGALTVELAMNVAQLQKDVTAVKSHLGGMAASVERTFSGLKGVIAGALSVTGIISGIKSVINAYAEEEAAVARLRSALRAHGIEAETVTQAYSDYAHALQTTTKWSAEAIMDAQALMTTMGVAPDKIKMATEAVLSFSYAFGKDLPESARLIANAMAGNFDRLGRYISDFKKLKGEVLTTSQILDIIASKTGNVAAREMNSYAASIAQLNNQWMELKETIGGLVVPALKDAVKWLNEVIGNIMALGGESSLAVMKTQLKTLEEIKKSGGGLEGSMGLGFTSTKTIDERISKLKEQIKTEEAYQAAVLKAGARGYKGGSGEPQDKNAAAKAKKALEFDKEVAASWMKLIEEQSAAERGWRQDQLDAAKFNAGQMLEQDKLFNEGAKEAGEDRIKRLTEMEEQFTEIFRNQLIARRDAYMDVQEQMSTLFSGLEGLSEVGKGMGNLQSIAAGTDTQTKQQEAAAAHFESMISLHREGLRTEAELDQDFANLVTSLESQTYSQRLSMASSYFGMMSGLASAYYSASDKQSRKAFELQKMAAIAMTIVDTIRAASSIYKWWADTTGNVYVAAAMAAIATAAGMMRVAQIQSTSFGSGGTASAGSRAGGGAASKQTTSEAYKETQTAPSYQPNINIYVYGNIVDQDKFSRELVPSLEKAIRDGVR